MARKRAGLVEDMGWREFQMLMTEGFRPQGYRVVETGGAGADSGVMAQRSGWL